MIESANAGAACSVSHILLYSHTPDLGNTVKEPESYLAMEY